MVFIPRKMVRVFCAPDLPAAVNRSIDLPLYRDYNTLFLKADHYNFDVKISENAMVVFQVAAFDWKKHCEAAFTIEAKTPVEFPWLAFPLNCSDKVFDRLFTISGHDKELGLTLYVGEA